MTGLKRRSGLAIVLLMLTASTAVAQSRAMKVLEGKVLGNGEVPLENAIVYLQSSKDTSIRSFIATSDGSYRFGQISPDIDYQVWAQYKNVKSATKPISSFDSRKNVTIDLKIKTDK
jgi:hypothetical protein